MTPEPNDAQLNESNRWVGPCGHRAMASGDTFDRGILHAVRASRLRAVVLAGVVSLTAMGASAVAHAESEADKATARQLAQEGIRLEMDGDYAKALDRLKRAQSLFHAPTHLWHIARCQVAMGHLIEGAETYRALAHWKLDDNAPDVFMKAKLAARDELPKLQARIPSVVVTVKPEKLEGLRVLIDGEQVPLAILGVARLVDPGTHEVQVEATGHKSLKKKVDLKEGESKPVSFVVRGKPAAGAVKPKTGNKTTKQSKSGRGDVKSAEKKRPPWYVSVNVGLSAPGGTVSELQADGGTTVFESRPMSELIKTGAGFGARVGWRFSDHFGVSLYLENDRFSGGEGVSLVETDSPIEFDSSGAVAVGGGADVTWRLCPECSGPVASLGLFGLGVGQTLTGGIGRECSKYISWTMTGVRLGGGYRFVLSDAWAVTPYFAMNVGTVGAMNVSGGGCGAGGKVLPDPSYDMKSTSAKTSYVNHLGVVGEFRFSL